jgi:hypothetical protein
MADVDIKKLLQRAIELVMPDLRHYYRLPRKGRVVKSYASAGSYWADVQPLRNDESDDPDEPLIPRVEIPVLWGGPERGVVCPPAEGTLCDITYYDGDPNYPRISDFRWQKNKAPACELGAFIIQQTPGIYLRLTPAGKLEIVSNHGSMDMGVLNITADVHITGELTVSKNIVATGNISDAGGSKSMAGMRETYGSHTHKDNSHGAITEPPGQAM